MSCNKMNMRVVKLTEAIKMVKEGKWIADYIRVQGKVEVSNDPGIPILSAGCNQNLYYQLSEDDKTLLNEAEIKFDTNKDGDSHIFINTNEDYNWVSICNFRRYGWCSSPEENAEFGYSGIIFANGDFTFTNEEKEEFNETDSRKMFLAVELSRLVGQLQKKRPELETVLFSNSFSKGLEFILNEASFHFQTINRKSSDEDITYHNKINNEK